MTQPLDMITNVTSLLQGLQLVAMKEQFQVLAEEQSWDPIPYLHELTQREQEHRTQKKIEGLLKRAKLPRELEY